MKKRTFKLVSWNVNGLRAVWKKGFVDAVNQLSPDILGIQETKIQDHQLTREMTHLDSYTSYWSCCKDKKGYSGVAVYSKIIPDHVAYGMGVDAFDREGRIIQMDFSDFIFFNIYFPNGQKDDQRLTYKLDFYEAFFTYANELKSQGKSLIIAGDYNTAHNEIDLKNPKANENRSGFLRIERDWMDRIIQYGYVDTFRYFHPDTVKYSWWTYRFQARKRNAGWRIDYMFVTQDIIDKGWIKEVFIENDIMGSDHCPVGLTLEIES